ncbi:glycosyltransferase family 2 protein [Salinigranum halophilum]|uniref:glycosyltransferase family 2 protein n=1 Tax=Salinigranum halophilum TaxID=2565931 RepID=UPI0010A8B271|nr:glycosyltransferase family 2 protein [Salinigranum halophilum]
MNATKTAVIILNWKDYEATKRCIKRLRELYAEAIDIIVVDNESENPEELSGYDCHVVVNSKNRGFAGGCNDGISKAIELDVEIVCFLNNDTSFNSDFISPLVELLSISSIGGVGGTIYTSSLNELWFGIGEWNPYFVSTNSDTVPDGVEKTDWITGCLFATRIEILQEIGGFDERYFLYLEDLDLSTRIKRRGYKLVATEKSKIQHEVGGTLGETTGPSTVRSYYVARNRILFAKIHFKKYKKIRSLILSSILSLIWGIDLVLNRQFEQAKAIIRGLVDGFRGEWGKQAGYP